MGKGDGVARYLKDLEAFDTVIMGRNTYEFGYKFGLKPGQLAGWLLENQQIDILKIKLNPFIQGIGVSLFGDSKSTYQLELLDTELYEYGLQIMTYKIRY